jgi:hypothetical protein
MAYQAIVARLTNVRKHPNADRLQLATVVGNQVVIGLDHEEGELGVYFPTDGQLSHEMCYENDLYNVPEANKNPVKGYMDTAKRRVRSQKFRGEASDGLWLPLTSLMWYADINQYREGDLINSELVCNKYITNATRVAGVTNKLKVHKGEALMFPKHYDTENFQYYWQDIPEGSIIYLTEKLHGTSGRLGHVKIEPVGWYEKLLRWITGKDRWAYLNGSRNVIIGETSGNGFYGDDSFRLEATKNISLRKGETIYFELVGDVRPGTPIMPPVSVPKELSDTRKQYGPIISYTYGCNSGECKLFVYRIVQFNEDGQATELSWPQVKRRCREIGLQHVPELTFRPDYDCEMNGFIWPEGPYEGYEYDPRQDAKETIDRLCDGPSTLDSTHLREGVCVRVETSDGRIYCLKNKSFAFKVLEGIIKLDDSYVDLEESA